ncbi:Ig-like domain-containing protein [Salicibibacter halophilus]|uniref:Ig-like domain-containing protein n=1 Tax=Salicibibacter halophilus TaxID=2502791 RepID=A0A514LG34_9BACI|nr:Ig-like domain-containing protein [Salicibibacter halophilus]
MRRLPQIKKRRFNTSSVILHRAAKMVVVGESPSPETIEVDPSSIDMEVGESQDLSVTVNYDDDSSETVTSDADFETDSNSIASMDGRTVEANNEGDTEITVSYEGLEATVEVEVEESSGGSGDEEGENDE